MLCTRNQNTGFDYTEKENNKRETRNSIPSTQVLQLPAIAANSGKKARVLAVDAHPLIIIVGKLLRNF